MMNHRMILACAIVFMCLRTTTAQTTKIDVDARSAIRSVNPLLYGINTARWDESLFPGPGNEMLLTCDRDAIRKIKASGITLLKYPGGNDADAYIWNSPDNNASEMDTDEYLALCREVGAEAFITVNFNASPELAAEWVRYCNKVKGAGVKYWEVGDEQWGAWAKGHSSPEEYARKYTTFVKAMKAVDPTIKVATNVALSGHTPSLGAQSEDWTSRVLKSAGDYVDLLTITFYPQQWGKENDDTLLASVATYRHLFQSLRRKVEQVVGARKASSLLYVNVGYNSVNHSAGLQTLQIVNALWVADMLGAMAEVGTDLGCFWAVHNFYPPRGGDFGYLSSDVSNTPRYSYYVFPMFTNHFGKELVEAKSSDPAVSVYAAKTGKALSCFVINKDKATTKRVELTFRNFVPQQRVSAWVLDEKRKYERLPALAASSRGASFDISPYSFVALQFIAADSVVPSQNLAVAGTASASSYSTTGPNFTAWSAIDGKLYTRWNSAAWTKSNGEEEQWFQLSWAVPQQFSLVRIRWGETWATRYTLEVSDDGQQWRTLRSVSDGKGGIEEFSSTQMSARFLRMNGKHGTRGISAYSIREIEVYDVTRSK